MTKEIPDFQLALVAVKTGPDYKVEVKTDVPVPKIQDDEVLVRLTSSGVCHSDLSFIDNSWGVAYLEAQVDIAGHEGYGYIVQHGKNVDATTYPAGTKVGVSLLYNTCRNCRTCLASDGEVFCLNRKIYARDLNGTWQQYVRVHSQYIIPVPDIPDYAAYQVGPILCGGVTVYKALKQANAQAGQTVVITGAGGGLGSMAIQYAAAIGLRIIAVDTGDDKKQLAISLGAESFIDYAKEDVNKEIQRATDNVGANIALAVAPTEEAYNQALTSLTSQGILVCIGLPKAGVNLTFPARLAVTKGLKIIGSLIGTRADLLEALDLLGKGKIKVPVTVYKPEDIQYVLKSMEKGELIGRAVIDLR